MLDILVSTLKERFSLVMLAERMEESMILLSHHLCLPLFRMAALRKNERRGGTKVSSLSFMV